MEKRETIEVTLSKIGIGKFQFLQLSLLIFVQSINTSIIWSIAFLGTILGCSWHITHVQESMLSMSLSFGLIIGSSAMGAFSDKYGRKPAMVMGNAVLLFFELVSAASPTFGWILIMRFIVGIFISGTSSSSYALVSELTPSKYRGYFVIIFQLSRPLGTFAITTFSFLVASRLGWRAFLSIISMLLILVLMALIWVSESPRYLALHNQKQKCLKLLNKIAKINKSQPIDDFDETISTKKSSFSDLIHSNYLSTTILLSFLSLVSGLFQYFAIVIVTIIDSIPHRCLQDMSTFSTNQDSNNITADYSCCAQMTWLSYKNLYISSIGEFLAVPVSLFLIYFIGRKKLMAALYLVIFVVTFLLNFCLTSLQLVIVFFILRGTISALLIINHMYGAEVYPTSVRSTGFGFSNSCTKVGVLLSPLIVNILIAKYSFMGGIMLLASLSFISIIICLFLPYETKDRQLYQTVDNDYANDKSNIPQEKPGYETLNKD